MPGKGRNSTPQALKKIRGTDQPCRSNSDSVDIPIVTKMPSTPKFLSKRGGDLYRSMGKEMMDLGLITNLSVPGYAIMVDALARYIDLAFEISKNGMYQRSVTDIRITINPITKGDDREMPETVAQYIKDGIIEYMEISLGNDSLHPRMKAQKDAEETFRKWASEFGMSPAAASKIIGNVMKGDTPDDLDFS